MSLISAGFILLDRTFKTRHCHGPSRPSAQQTQDSTEVQKRWNMNLQVHSDRSILETAAYCTVDTGIKYTVCAWYSTKILDTTRAKDMYIGGDSLIYTGTEVWRNSSTGLNTDTGWVLLGYWRISHVKGPIWLYCICESWGPLIYQITARQAGTATV